MICVPLKSLSIDKLIGRGPELLPFAGAELQQTDVHLLASYSWLAERKIILLAIYVFRHVY